MLVGRGRSGNEISAGRYWVTRDKRSWLKIASFSLLISLEGFTSQTERFSDGFKWLRVRSCLWRPAALWHIVQKPHVFGCKYHWHYFSVLVHLVSVRLEAFDGRGVPVVLSCFLLWDGYAVLPASFKNCCHNRWSSSNNQLHYIWNSCSENVRLGMDVYGKSKKHTKVIIEQLIWAKWRRAATHSV